jgi:hypothetical protein
MAQVSTSRAGGQQWWAAWVALTIGVAALAPSVLAAGPVADRCYADWSDAAPVVRREALVPTMDLLQQARARKMGDLVRITLCEQQGRFVYRLVVLQAKGQFTNLTVDARRPF